MRTGAASSRIDLTDRRFARLPSEQRAWIEQTLGSQFIVADVVELERQPNLTSAQRSILLGLRQTVSGELRTTAGSALTANGVVPLSDIRSMTVGAARAATGETELQQRVRAELPEALIGHEDQLEPFVELVRRSQSPAWMTAPQMAIVGRAGHGQAEALDRYAKITLGDDARVVTVDLAAYAGSPSAAFGKNGALSTETLKTYEPGYVPPKAKDGEEQALASPAIVRLTGVENLRTTNADAAKMLAGLLSTRKGAPDFVNVTFVFDFDVPVGNAPRQLMIDALGEVGVRYMCAAAEFVDLGVEPLLAYGESLLLDNLALQGGGNTVLEIDEDAKRVLGEALKTPFDPMGELDVRLYEWVTSKFDTATSVNRDRDVLRLSLNPAYAEGSAELAALIEALHQPFADPKLGADLFLLRVVGEQVEEDPRIEIAVRRGLELARTLQDVPVQIALGLPPADAEATDLVVGVLGAVRELGAVMGDKLLMAKKQQELRRMDVLPDADWRLLADAIDHAAVAIGALDDRAMFAFPAEWLTTVRAALVGFVGAAEKIADVIGSQGAPGGDT